MKDDVYFELAQTGPYEAQFGSALITMVEPHVGSERAYNRWYEDDHFITGAMTHPWVYAGRRWVAPVTHQRVRHPIDSPVARPIEAGKYLSTYWVTAGQHEPMTRWSMGTNYRAVPDGRIFQERDHVFTSWQQYLGTIYRDAEGPRDIHALYHPYRGLVLEVIDAVDAAASDALVDWVFRERVPATNDPVAMGTVFAPIPFPDDKRDYVDDVAGVDTRLTILWFTEVDPLETWDLFAVDPVAPTRLGRVALMAPFIPTIPGTNRYVDELR